MLTLFQIPTNQRSLRVAALLAVVLSTSGRPSFAADDVVGLVDEGLNRIVADEVTERMAKFLEAYRVSDLKAVAINGTFRSLTNEDLQQQMTSSLDSRGITVEGTTNVTFDGKLIVTETKEETIVVMECTLIEADRGELCTVRVRKVLPAGSGS